MEMSARYLTEPQPRRRPRTNSDLTMTNRHMTRMLLRRALRERVRTVWR